MYPETVIKHQKVLQMQDYIQHGDITTYDHCLSVAHLSCSLNKKYHLHCDKNSLFMGAVLHDFFLYDWHIQPLRRWHGFTHPKTASQNAKKYFTLDDKTENIILSHMWPLTPLSIPKSKEAWLVCFVDKYLSTRETVHGLQNHFQHILNR